MFLFVYFRFHTYVHTYEWNYSLYWTRGTNKTVHPQKKCVIDMISQPDELSLSWNSVFVKRDTANSNDQNAAQNRVKLWCGTLRMWTYKELAVIISIMWRETWIITESRMTCTFGKLLNSVNFILNFDLSHWQV